MDVQLLDPQTEQRVQREIFIQEELHAMEQNERFYRCRLCNAFIVNSNTIRVAYVDQKYAYICQTCHDAHSRSE